jgi:hypothetical protein
MRVRTGVSTCPVLPIFPAPRALCARDVGHGFREESARHPTSSAPELSLRLGGNVRGLAELGGRISIDSGARGKRRGVVRYCSCVLVKYYLSLGARGLACSQEHGAVSTCLVQVRRQS